MMFNKNQAQYCAQLIKGSHRIAVLTGAGISTNAGIPDFRGPKGLYVTRQYDAEIVFDISYFVKDQKPFYEFAADFMKLEDQISPTFTHFFLSKLEAAGKLSGIVTQNIDSLHQRAGSRHVLEMHGSFERSYCFNCGQEFLFSEMKQKVLTEMVPRCSCSGVIKPDVVFFGENVKYFDAAVELARQSDLFLIIGSSCVVYPAALIPTHTSGKIVIVNQGKVELLVGQIVLEVHEDTDVFFKQVSDFLF